MDRNTWLMQGDCLERMREIPDGSVDMVLCDLPYGVTQNEWDVPIPFDALWDAYKRVCKPNAAIVLHCQQPFTSKLISSNYRMFKYCLVWSKHAVSGFLNAKKQPLRNCEDIAVFYCKQCTYNPIMRKGKMKEKGKRGGSSNYGEYHTTQNKNDIYYPTTLLDFPAERIRGGGILLKSRLRWKNTSFAHTPTRAKRYSITAWVAVRRALPL